ncbi:MAG: hypothetical protein H6861_03675 [Rhodospirillales bacterium]|nr:hypothetical protein [Rhodospirillales bacterium]
MNFIIQYIDVLWLPLGLLAVHKPQRGWAAGFFIGCMVMMRLQAELIISTGYENGFLGLFETSVHRRGQIAYSVFYVLYIALAVYSPNTKGVILMAASISMFFTAMLVSMIVMII